MTQMTPVSQEDLIFRHLELGGTITPLEALNLYGCFRLGARIWDLRQKGYNIQMKLVGNDKHYAQYSLVPKEERQAQENLHLKMFRYHKKQI